MAYLWPKKSIRTLFNKEAIIRSHPIKPTFYQEVYREAKIRNPNRLEECLRL